MEGRAEVFPTDTLMLSVSQLIIEHRGFVERKRTDFPRLRDLSLVSLLPWRLFRFIAYHSPPLFAIADTFNTLQAILPGFLQPRSQNLETPHYLQISTQFVYSTRIWLEYHTPSFARAMS